MYLILHLFIQHIWIFTYQLKQRKILKRSHEEVPQNREPTVTDVTLLGCNIPTFKVGGVHLSVHMYGCDVCVCVYV